MKRILYVSICVIAIVSCKDDSPAPGGNPGDLRPKACFTIPATGTQGTALTFDASCTTDATSYHWYFGDGQEATSVGAQHSYAIPGKYSVKLKVEKSGVKDSLIHDITISLTPNQTSCLPTYLFSPELWPEEGYDSVTVTYTSNKKVDAITQRRVGSRTDIYSKLAFAYNGDGKISTVEVIFSGIKTGIYTFLYDEKRLPSKLSYVEGAGDTLLAASFKHNEKNQLTEINARNWMRSCNFRYQYDINGNTTKIFHTLGSGLEELERENHSFDNSVVYYYSSPELRQYVEYINFGGVYQNNVRTGHINSTITPDLNSTTIYNAGSGFDFTGKSTMNGALNMISRYEAATDVDSYSYTCF
jgi:PKD repeat protein